MKPFLRSHDDMILNIICDSSYTDFVWLTDIIDSNYGDFRHIRLHEHHLCVRFVDVVLYCWRPLDNKPHIQINHF